MGEVRIFHNGKLIATRNAPVPSATPVTTTTAEIAATLSAATLTRARSNVTEAQRAATARSTPVDKLADEFDAALTPGENHFTVVAFNGANTLNARPVTREIIANLPAEPRRVALLSMGINDYAKSADVDTLRYAVKDADDFAKEITATLAAAAPDTTFMRINLRDRDATRERFLRTFDELAHTLKPTDIFLWLVASHGTLDSAAQYGIIPHDWDGKPDPRSLVSASEILEALRKLPPLTQFFVFDTCHAGGLNSLARGLYDARLAVLARNMGLHIFACASAAEEAIDGHQGNGLFTHTLLKGLRSGAADANGDKQVSVSELGRYASRETARIAQGTFRHAQQPVAMSYGKDWTLHVLRDTQEKP